MTSEPIDDTEAGTRTLPPWWVLLLVALAIGAVAFSIGRFSTFGIAGSTPADDSADAGFARDMQVHHSQAVEMAMTIYAETDDDELRTLAYDIATGQSAQRGEMFDWLVQWGLPQYGSEPMAWMSASGDPAHGAHQAATEDGSPMTDEEMRQAMGMASEEELQELRAATGRAADCQFLTLMIRHHEGAIPMADAVIELGSDERVTTVAESMKKGQTFEIQAMTSMQQRLGCTG
ncbi:DUF305 domain-containing protein [Microbacterium sp. EYE_5]|uniref:DUF305 domain-containing protein n=1 Tax=unclassified Microbacterium TaxID=2609290 RepID=UPI002004078B|nr:MULTISPECIES: DUF305 domain-containing protein [unclassified Microbacterium]MCK6080286.1 DUF305 domain-containing protein [Microbacterium sp. EYE_382]MCK6085557.1 DUF305 domain-containing protein [Microbacterium sp. EYE_384]MCK6122218.1 DUF305 domain-containing protein [Microbacterium sp. EYE_80]MCK6126320.1 DUF305 domain-containing protein [Microbacterium sp. EYE_79]MCK6141241.1 DUF305 domain-containing protein [Microbacterium sp. EYE_39]